MASPLLRRKSESLQGMVIWHIAKKIIYPYVLRRLIGQYWM
jgi:hypothetical protein